jgi:hypothetical protein
MFNSKQELEDYRKLKELKLQYKANSKGDREVKVSVSFDYREPCQQ